MASSDAAPETFRKIGGDESLYTDEVAKRLGISPRTVCEYSTVGKPVRVRNLPGVLMRVMLRRVRLGNNFVYRRLDVDDFVNECRAVEVGANRGARCFNPSSHASHRSSKCPRVSNPTFSGMPPLSPK
jgi:hypothetical protein